MVAITSLLSLAGCHERLSSRQQFDTRVVPVLESTCTSSSCHGASMEAEATGQVIDWDQLIFQLGDGGKLVDLDAAYVTAKRTISTTEEARFSSLLAKPLSQAYGGSPHYGLDKLGNASSSKIVVNEYMYSKSLLICIDFH